MTEETKKPERPMPLRAQRDLVRSARGRKDSLNRKLWTRVSDEMGKRVDAAGLHMSLRAGRAFIDADTIRALIELGLDAYLAKYPNLMQEITPP